MTGACPRRAFPSTIPQKRSAMPRFTRSPARSGRWISCSNSPGGPMKATHPHGQTAHFDLENRDRLIRFEEGLIGFPECKDFVLKENDDLAPFCLLQSLELLDLGFLVLEPTM